MGLWDQGQFMALLDNTVNGGQGERGRLVQGGSVASQEENAERANKITLISEIIRQAVRRTMIREGGGVIGQGDACTKTGRAAQSEEYLRGGEPRFRK